MPRRTATRLAAATLAAAALHAAPALASDQPPTADPRPETWLLVATGLAGAGVAVGGCSLKTHRLS